MNVQELRVKVSPKGWKAGTLVEEWEVSMFVRFDDNSSQLVNKRMSRKPAIWEAQAFLNDLVVGDD